ncbi:MAG: hypothetical protein DRQ88_01420 [Epsilonproteobacteria bacterium]|nr:MAG: hypothetical protein DRQ89_05490 [Campylobacterota bacterium]RLA67952.1 MAG: hypothetical protein DRQ88_01420 [Campylobacterota bacterium]
MIDNLTLLWVFSRRLIILLNPQKSKRFQGAPPVLNLFKKVFFLRVEGNINSFKSFFNYEQKDLLGMPLYLELRWFNYTGHPVFVNVATLFDFVRLNLIRPDSLRLFKK